MKHGVFAETHVGKMLVWRSRPIGAMPRNGMVAFQGIELIGALFFSC